MFIYHRLFGVFQLGHADIPSYWSDCCDWVVQLLCSFEQRAVCSEQEAQLMLTNPRDVFRGQSRSLEPTWIDPPPMTNY